MIPDITPVNTWAGNGSNITFDFDFLINKESELQVLHTSKDGIQTELQLNKDYTIYQIGNENGSYITFPILGSSYSVLSDDEKISLVLNIPKAQTSPYGTSSKLNLTALEHSLDYIVRLIQMVDRKADRAVKVQEGSDISPEKLINSLKQSEINSRDYAQTAIDKALDAEESAQTAKEQADIATQKTQEVADLYDGAIVDITQRHNTAINEINKLHESVNIDIDSINTVKEEALNNVIAEGQNQIELIKEQGSSYATKEDAKYTAGNGIDITDNIISNTQTSAEWGNITGNIENQEDLVNYVKKYSGGLEVCDIGMSLYIDETKGLRRWLNGQIVDINANTQAFLDRLKQIVALYPSLSCTEEEWQSIKSASAFGQVGKFVFNYNPELIIEVVSVRIPAVVNVQGLLDLQNLGMTVKAGLPNIEGMVYYGHGYLANATGAFYRGNAGTLQRVTSGGAQTDYNLIFDASRSNPIYGATDTVQEEAIQYPYYIQIATGQETEVNITNEIELNNPFFFGMSNYFKFKPNSLAWLKPTGYYEPKAAHPDYYNWILENVNKGVEGFKGQEGYCFIATESSSYYWWVSTESPVVGASVYRYDVGVNSMFFDGTVETLTLNGFTFTSIFEGSSYTVTRDSSKDTSILHPAAWITDNDFEINTSDETFRLPLLDGSECLVSDRYIDLTLQASGTKYTAVANGFVFFEKLNTSNTQFVKGTNLSSGYSDISYGTYSGSTPSILLKVKRGDIFSIDYDAAGVTNSFRFIYARGNGSLYYYVGETVQNANLIDAGRMQEQITNINAPSRGYLVQSYVNGRSWYRVYSDGWCEQGGQITVTVAATNITLLKSYKDNNYNAVGCQANTNTAGYHTINVAAYSATQVQIRQNAVGSPLVNWIAMGYIK